MRCGSQLERTIESSRTWRSDVQYQRNLELQSMSEKELNELA